MEHRRLSALSDRMSTLDGTLVTWLTTLLGAATSAAAVPLRGQAGDHQPRDDRHDDADQRKGHRSRRGYFDDRTHVESAAFWTPTWNPRRATCHAPPA